MEYCERHQRQHTTLCFDVLAVIVGVVLITKLLLITKYIHHFRQSHQGARSSFLFIFDSVFFLTCALSLGAYQVAMIYWCRDARIFKIADNIATPLYAAETLMLIGLMYRQVYTIFKDTSFALRKCSVAMLSALYLLTAFVTSVTSFSWVNRRDIDDDEFQVSPIIAANGALVVFLTLLLVALFVYKLYQVHLRRCEAKQDSTTIIELLTKVSVLASISICCTMITFVLSAIVAVESSFECIMTLACMSVVDMTTNFTCIYLSHSYFTAYYVKMCGCCDSTCHSAWRKWSNSEDLEMMATNIQDQPSNTPPSQK